MFLSPLPFSSLKSPSLLESDQNPHQSILFSIRTLALSISPPLPENPHLECSDVGNRGKSAMGSEDGNLEAVERDLEALLSEHQEQEQDQVGSDRAFFNIHRSGSAPPTVDGSMRAIGGLRAIPGLGEAGALLTDEDFRSNPAYLDYLYSTESCNPRLPPRISRDDLRATQRFGGVGHLRKSVGDVDGSSSSLFSLQPGVSARDQETQGRMNGQWSSVQNAASFERGNNNVSGLTGVGLGARRKSFADVLQEELSQPTALPHLSLSTGQNTLENFGNLTSITNDQIGMHQNLESSDSLRSSGAYSGLHRIQSFGSSASHSPSGRASSFTRSQTPDPQLIRRSPSPCLPPIGARSVTPTNGVSACSTGHGDITGALSGLNLTKSRSVGGGNHSDSLYQDLSDHSEFQFDVSNNKNPYQQPSFNNSSPARPISSPSNPMLMAYDLSKKNGFPPDQYTPKVSRNDKGYFLKSSSSNDMYNKASSVHFNGYSGYRSAQPSNMDFTENDIRNFAMNQRLPELINNQFDADAISFGATDGKYRRGNQGGNGFESSLLDPLFMQHLGKADLATQPGLTFADSGGGRSYADASALELSAYQKAYLETVLAQQKLQHVMPYLGKSASFDHGYYDSAAYGLGLPYSGSTVSPSNPGNLLRSERFLRHPSLVKNAVGGSLGSLIPDNGLKEPGLSTFLEEFKSSKNRNFELSEIAGHIVEFSADQYGSRFIQQKLETASVEEKNMIFPEILPRARTLMTDVFGNYVIQKFFEHGTESQRSQLANQLINHVLPLSLQMYGCRVIQKALEVVDVDLQTQMVSELDGSVIKCVRDQNGNHVIQKCIELVPQEKIQFIITTFYGQVVTLSTHPYGCRVIQRVLEHCDDAETQRIMMGEILQSVCTLALDQYGNYVVQHVLQHGKPEERTAIISTLAGQIVKMSQQKFASNVVEKCLTFGSPDERQLLINEMLGSTDENEPLQAMMKDQFGNYVVQKVLEICDDQNRELILSRIKVHLNALKRYTYGKHIVARVEKLITAGERRIGILSYSS